MIDRSRIGFRTAPTSVAVDAWRVKLFCQAIGETDAVYFDPAVARAAGHPACPVPPTFLKAIEGEHFSSAELMKMLAVPLRGVLHAEQAFEHLAPVYVGDTVEVSRTVTDIYDKFGDTLKLSASLITVKDGAAHYELRARTVTGTELVSGTARVAASATVRRALT